MQLQLYINMIHFEFKQVNEMMLSHNQYYFVTNIVIVVANDTISHTIGFRFKSKSQHCLVST